MLTKRNFVDYLSILKSPVCNYKLIEHLYGVSLGSNGDFFDKYNTWLTNKKKKQEKTGEINRFRFETFLQEKQLLTVKFAAVRLGMKKESLIKVIKKMQENNLLLTSPFRLQNDFFDEEIVKVFHNPFTSISFIVFADHNSYCRQLHDAIKKEINVDINPEYCVVSEALGNPIFAYQFDCITREALSVKYQLWLKLNKPINLSPDVISVKTFFSDEESFKNLLYGEVKDRVTEKEKMKIRSK